MTDGRRILREVLLPLQSVQRRLDRSDAGAPENLWWIPLGSPMIAA